MKDAQFNQLNSESAHGASCRDFVSAIDYDATAALGTGKERMPSSITQGRYTRDAITGTMVKLEDRADAVSRLLSKAGSRLIGYDLTFGEFDFMSIAEMPNDTQAAAVLLAAAGDLAPGFKSAGGT